MACPNQSAVKDFPTYKVVVVGDNRVGKTSLARRHIQGNVKMTFDCKCFNRGSCNEIATLIEVHPLDFETNHGRIRFSLWDTPTCDDLPPDFLKDAQCAIFMFDLTNRASYDHLWTLYSNHQQVFDNITIVLCGNKVDLLEKREVDENHVTFHRVHKHDYFEMSAIKNTNYEKPFVFLARKLSGDPNLHFVESPALAPPEVQID